MERLTDREYTYYSCDFMEDGVYELANKLREYEDLEEQGLLLRLPCKVKDTVYYIGRSIFECFVDSFGIYKTHICVSLKYGIGSVHVDISQFGKTVFLTKEEAEAALEKMKGEGREKG